MLSLATLAFSYAAPPPRAAGPLATHVAATGEPGDAFIHPRDIHLFASDPGALPTMGNVPVFVSNSNYTVKEYTMIFGPLVTSSGSTLGKRNITAVMTTTKDGTMHTYTGTAFIVTAGPASQLRFRAGGARSFAGRRLLFTG